MGARPGSASTWRVVSSILISFPSRISDEIDQGYAGLSRLHSPVAQGGPADIHPETFKHFFLPVKREMVDELAGQHMGQKSRTGDGPGDDLGDNRGDPHTRPVILHALTAAAGIFGTDMAQHLDPGRDDVELLADLFPDPAQLAAAGADLLFLGQIMDDFNPGQFRRQRFTAGLFAVMGRNRHLGRLDVLRLRQVEQRQLHRGRVRRQLLAPPPEQQLAQVVDLLKEKFVLPAQISHHPL